MTETTNSLLGSMFNAEWLMDQRFKPLEYVVPGLIPEGLTVLASSPKVGKSWLVLGVAVAAASGGFALGHLRVPQRPVLYLALEDGPRRLQRRLDSLGVRPPKSLHMLTRCQPGQLLATLNEFIALYAEAAPLVILDTLGKALPPPLGNETTYSRDYRVAGALKGVADQCPGSAVVVVHHTRKADSSDFLDAVSGTQGISGAADTVAVLRRERESAEAVLHVTSRDAAEGSYGLTLDRSGRWELNGADLEQAAQAAATTTTTAGVGDRMAELIAYVNQHPEGSRRAEVAAALHIDDETVGKYLRRAAEAGRIANPSRGLYTPVPTVPSVLFPPAERDTQPTKDTPLSQEDPS